METDGVNAKHSLSDEKLHQANQAAHRAVRAVINREKAFRRFQLASKSTISSRQAEYTRACDFQDEAMDLYKKLVSND